MSGCRRRGVGPKRAVAAMAADPPAHGPRAGSASARPRTAADAGLLVGGAPWLEPEAIGARPERARRGGRIVEVDERLSCGGAPRLARPAGFVAGLEALDDDQAAAAAGNRAAVVVSFVVLVGLGGDLGQGTASSSRARARSVQRPPSSKRRSRSRTGEARPRPYDRRPGANPANAPPCARRHWCRRRSTR
jgi:hypothetical protein